MKNVIVALALAFIYHIAISNNVLIILIAEFMASLCQNLMIEFVPKEDSQIQVLLASRKDIFADYTLDNFINAFSKYFSSRESVDVKGQHELCFLYGR